MALFHIYNFTVNTMPSSAFYAYHLLFGLTITYLTYSFLGKAGEGRHNPFVRAIDYVLALLSAGVCLYIVMDLQAFLIRIQTRPSNTDILVGIIAIIVVLEATRRTTGFALPIIASVSLAYAYFGRSLPGVLSHRGYSLTRIVSTAYSEHGIFGIPIGVSATTVFLFVLFAAFLNSNGADVIFKDISLSIAGKQRGGPAKIAVVASSLFGSISGSAVANVVSTGAFTIPLMKKQGYRKSFAGAVEAVSSTGGQIMPPIMGAAAFILADIVGVPYVRVCIAALLPALMYYVCLFIMVDIESAKENMHGLPADQIPVLMTVIKRGAKLLVPIAVLLFYLLALKKTPMDSAIAAIASVVIFGLLDKVDRLSIGNLLGAFEGGASSALQVITACATSGIVIGMLSLTGLGIKLSNIIMNLGGQNIFLSLILSMFICIILGMGLPTTAAYIITATTISPALIKLGINPLGAHLFLLYFASLSAITPPVAVASYAAAGISGEGPMKVSIEAVKLGIIGFVVPYAFVLNPTLLAPHFTLNLVFTIIAALTSCFAFAYAIKGWAASRIPMFVRILLFALGLALLSPFVLAKVLALGALIALAFYQRYSLRTKLHKIGA